MRNVAGAEFFLKVSIGVALLILGSAPSLLAVTGKASWYGGGEKLNKHTASGEIFDPNAMTCASYAFPIGSVLEVTNLRNGKKMVVRVNDLGPKKSLKRVVDLSKKSFSKIASLTLGVIDVNVEVVP